MACEIDANELRCVSERGADFVPRPNAAGKAVQHNERWTAAVDFDVQVHVGA